MRIYEHDEKFPDSGKKVRVFNRGATEWLSKLRCLYGKRVSRDVAKNHHSDFEHICGQYRLLKEESGI